MCKNGNCRQAAVYGYNKGKPLYCSEHRLHDTYNTKLIRDSEPLAKSLLGNTVPLEEPKVSLLGKPQFPLTEPRLVQKCGHPPASTRYKGYCANCYMNAFPDDPLSLQTLYKSRATVIQKFIDSKFDGFVHCPEFSSIQINGKTLCVVYGSTLNDNDSNNCIFIRFSPNKYTQLYTQLPKLEQQIADQIEIIVL